MSMEQVEGKLESWNRGLMVCVGTCTTLLFLAITSPQQSMSEAWGWYLLWVVFQVAVTPLGFVLFVSKSWRELPLSQRLNTAFGYLAVAWSLFFAFLIKTNHDTPYLYGGLVTLALYGLVLGAAVGIGSTYWLLRRTYTNSPEEMFP